MQDSEVKEKMVQMGLTPRFLAGKSFEKLVTDAVKSVPELIQYNKALPEG